MTKTVREQNILAMETSGSTASLVLFANGEEILSAEWTAQRSHNSRIFDILEEARPLLELHRPDLILVGAGPGSYSGIRVALAVADGLGMAYGASVVAVNSWEALPHGGRDALVLSDARRGGWALGYLAGGKWIGLLRITDRDETDQAIQLAKSEGKYLLSCETEEKLESWQWSGFQTGLTPQASLLISSWNSKTLEEQEILKNAPPAPLYVREPNITPAKCAAWQKGLA